MITKPSGPEPLWRNRDFRRLWVGQTISQLGSQISFLAIPLVAVLALHANAFQTGLLVTFEFLPFLLFGLPAGVWVDRLSHRAVMVVADLVRFAALGSIPVAAAIGHLTLLHLYVASFVSGVLTVFFDVAYQSCLPSLVDRSRLVEGNSRLEFSRAGAEVVGPAVAGVLVRAVGAATAVAADAVSYLVSALFLLGVRMPSGPAPSSAPRSMVRELREGLVYVVRHPSLRAIAGCTGSSNLLSHACFAIVILFAVRDLGLSAPLIGLWFSIGSLGAPLGALAASRLSRRLGAGPAIILTAGIASPNWLLVAFAPRSMPLPFLFASGLIGSSMGVAYNIVQVSMRQAITPHHLLGRMNATMRFFVWGTIPVGAFLGGVLGTALGLRPALIVFAVAGLLTPLPVVFSPLRGLREVSLLMPPSDADLTMEAPR